MKRSILALLGLFFCSQAYAADSTVSGMTAGSALDGTELFYGVQGGADRKVTGAQIKTYANSSGVVTSIATSCGVSGGTITSTGTISGQVVPNPQTGTNYDIVTGDCGKLVNLSNGSNQVPTIAQAGTTGFASGYFVNVCNQGAGTQTITPATWTIGGAATYVLGAGTAAAPICVGIVSDGTNYQVVPSSAGTAVSGANPSATGSDTAVNGAATTYMRSDGAPAIQKGTNAQFGLAQGDNTSVSMTAGVVGTKAVTGDCQASAGSLALSCNSPSANYISSNWYIAGLDLTTPGSAANSNTNNGTVSCYPFYFRGAATINALGAFVGTVSVGGNYSLAIYAHNATTNRPTGTTLGSSGSLSTTTSTSVASGAISITVASPRWLWACSNSDNGTATLRGATFFGMASYMGTATQANIFSGSGTAALSGVTTPLAFASGWTDLTGATWTEVNSRTWPLVEFKIN